LIDFIIRSGRALMFPIYKGTYERLDGNSFENYVTYGDVWRDAAIKFAKDLGRSIDYLETRPEIDQDKLAYYGFSMGASEGPRLITLEPRIKAGLLFFGGAYEREWPAEIDSFNFAPHVQVPILMVGARYDAIFSLEASQVPLFKFLGTPEADKQHSVKDVAHGVLNADIIKEALEWLDRYLGPVKSR
jgi:dienelactone hydrolase